MASNTQIGILQAPGTFSWSDLYGGSTFNQAGAPTKSYEEIASGDISGTAATGVTMSWLGMVLALVILRVLMHLQGH